LNIAENWSPILETSARKALEQEREERTENVPLEQLLDRSRVANEGDGLGRCRTKSISATEISEGATDHLDVAGSNVTVSGLDVRGDPLCRDETISFRPIPTLRQGTSPTK
jgi:hypothetical protein